VLDEVCVPVLDELGVPVFDEVSVPVFEGVTPGGREFVALAVIEGV
jgi:hypothetical protein